MKKSKKIEVVPEVVEAPKLSDVFPAKVIQQAPNLQWIYCVPVSRDLGKIAAIIPRRFSNKLVGKIVLIEAISDSLGTSYRYVEEQAH